MAARMIPYGRQNISEADIQAVVEVLRSDFLTQGPAVDAFETSLATHCGTPAAVAVNSATSGLHLACLALGVGPGSRVWTSPNTFVASANAPHLCGAQVEFVDIDPDTWNLCPKLLEQRLQAAEQTGTLPDLLIPVHFAGEPCDMQAIQTLAQRYGFLVLEDAAHAIGARYKQQPIGNCSHSDLAVFSFHPVKIITTAEGGAVTGQNVALLSRIAQLRSHGITKDPAEFVGPVAGAWDYQMQALGLNYRITDLQAALGSQQMTRLDSFIERRHQLAERYRQLLAGMPVRFQKMAETSRSALHLMPVWLDPELFDRRRAFDALRQNGIGVQVHDIPVHTQPYWRNQLASPADCPNAEHYYAGTISLPLFADLSDQQQDQVCAALRDALERAQIG